MFHPLGAGEEAWDKTESFIEINMIITYVFENTCLLIILTWYLLSLFNSVQLSEELFWRFGGGRITFILAIMSVGTQVRLF